MFIRTPIRHLLPLLSLAILASTTCAQSAQFTSDKVGDRDPRRGR